MSASNYLFTKGASDAFVWRIAGATPGLGALLVPLAPLPDGRLRRA